MNKILRILANQFNIRNKIWEILSNWKIQNKKKLKPKVKEWKILLKCKWMRNIKIQLIKLSKVRWKIPKEQPVKAHNFKNQKSILQEIELSLLKWKIQKIQICFYLKNYKKIKKYHNFKMEKLRPLVLLKVKSRTWTNSRSPPRR